MSDNLPPLPPCAPEFKPRWPNDPGGYTADQMKAYARAAIEKDREQQSVPALTDDWITRHSMLGADCAGASTVVLASSLRRLLAAAPQPQPVQQAISEIPKSWFPGLAEKTRQEAWRIYQTYPQAPQPLSNADGLQISRALHHHGLTLVRTAQGFGVMKLGEITAQADTKGTT